MFNTMRRIHFIGIGGIGMSGIAEILVNSGYQVSGSDIKSSAVTERLAKLGAKISYKHDAKLIDDVDVVVVSSAINKQNVEIIAATNKRIPIIHRSEMLAELMRLKYGVIVAGTHGKTTTTSMLASALSTAGLDPTIIIGGRLNSMGSNAKLGKGELFVVEADESDGSFLRLMPAVAIVTNIDMDHMDHYPTFDAIVNAFHQFLDKVPFYGAICACIDDPGVQLVLPKLRRRLVTFGLRPDADITAVDISFEGFSSKFTPVVFGKKQKPVHLKMPGRFNVTNAIASFAVANVLGADYDKVAQALSDFEGVEHRFTIVGSEKGVTVVDDYAHNPKKIEATLKAAREAYPEKRVIAVFQPHRYSRLKHLWDQFAASFADADYVVVTPIYAASEAPLSGITSESIAQAITTVSFQNKRGTVVVADDLSGAAKLAAEASDVANSSTGAIVISLGAGDVKNVGPQVLEKLRRK